MNTAVDRADLEFRRVFGHAPVGMWTAPGRVNLIGDHTDYNGGFVLPLALRQGACVSIAPALGGETRVRSMQRAADVFAFRARSVVPADVVGWASYVAGVFWSLREAGHRVPDCDVLVDSTVPLGAGLSSSAALECAVITALADLGDLTLSRTELALLAQRAENDFVGAPTGIMDQMASLHGAEGNLVLIDTRSLDVRPVPLPLAERGLELLVVDTHTPHALVDGQYAVRRATCTRAAEMLGVGSLRDVQPADLDAALVQLPDEAARKRVRHVVTENARVIETVSMLDAGADPRLIGPVLTASHISLRDDYEVSVPQVDVAVQGALDAGAYGARITGGGFGGCAIALIDAGSSQDVVAAITVSYRSKGFGEPSCLLARPSNGASRLR